MKSTLQRLRNKRWLSTFVIYLRYLIGGAYVFAAFPKISGERFTSVSGEDVPIDQAWHFFETLYRSGIYWEFLGWSQVIAGFLLMTQRLATLGAVVFLPVSINIFMITVSYQFRGTIVITSLMLLANIFLLLWDYNRLQHLLLPDKGNDILIKSINDKYSSDNFWNWLGLLLFATTIVYVLVQNRNPMGWFLLCVLEGLTGWIYMKRKSLR
jgi:hypothetical protein